MRNGNTIGITIGEKVIGGSSHCLLDTLENIDEFDLVWKIPLNLSNNPTICLLLQQTTINLLAFLPPIAKRLLLPFANASCALNT